MAGVVGYAAAADNNTSSDVCLTTGVTPGYAVTLQPPRAAKNQVVQVTSIQADSNASANAPCTAVVSNAATIDGQQSRTRQKETPTRAIQGLVVVDIRVGK
jgi:hypothetical protein